MLGFGYTTFGWRKTLVTPPSVLPVTMEELQAQLKCSDDDMVEAVRKTKCAVRLVEDMCDYAMTPQTWEVWTDGAPWNQDFLELARPPVSAIVDFKYYTDANDTANLFAAASYRLDPLLSRCVLRLGYSWPCSLRSTLSMVVKCTCGHATVDMIPPPLVEATLQVLGWLWRNPEAGSGEKLFGDENLRSMTAAYRRNL
jgi:hypothetical protein